MVHIYVDDVIFGTTNESLCKDFFEMMHNGFKMSIIGEIWYFLEHQVHQVKEVTFINQAKYFK